MGWLNPLRTVLSLIRTLKLRPLVGLLLCVSLVTFIHGDPTNQRDHRSTRHYFLTRLRFLKNFLSPQQYIGVANDHAAKETAPPHTSEPGICPTSANSMLLRLRAKCPFRYESIDNGLDATPKYSKSVVCLCQNCIGSNIDTCHEARRDVPIYRRIHTERGLVVYQKEIRKITVGCFCAGPEPAAAATVSGVGQPPLTN